MVGLTRFLPRSQVGTLLFGGAQNARTREFSPTRRTFKLTRDEYEELLAAHAGAVPTEADHGFGYALATHERTVAEGLVALARRRREAGLPLSEALRLRLDEAEAAVEAEAAEAAEAEAAEAAAAAAGEAPPPRPRKKAAADSAKTSGASEGLPRPGVKVVEFDIESLRLDLPSNAATKKGAAKTDAATLRRLAGKPFEQPPVHGLAYEQFGGGAKGAEACEAIDALVSMGAIETMLSNFILPLQENADAQSRVHCSLNLNTETGRLSSRAPNLQNQPALEKDQYRIREAFCASVAVVRTPRLRNATAHAHVARSIDRCAGRTARRSSSRTTASSSCACSRSIHTDAPTHDEPATRHWMWPARAAP